MNVFQRIAGAVRAEAKADAEGEPLGKKPKAEARREPRAETDRDHGQGEEEEADELHDVEQISVLIGDVDLQNLLSVWPRIFDSEELEVEAASAIDVGIERADELLRRATILGFVRADGTVHDAANAFLRTRILNALDPDPK